MDELKISTPFMKRLVCKIVKFAVRKSLGIDINVELREFEAQSDGRQIHLALSGDAYLRADDVKNLVNISLFGGEGEL